MKADYNSLLYAYESNNIDILDIITGDIDAALEAESNTTTNDTIKSDGEKSISKTMVLNKLIEQVKKLIQKILGMYDSFKRKLTNRLRLLGETDKGFYNLYYKKKSMIKPYKNVKVITYEYKNQMLTNQMEKILSEITMCLDKLRAIKGTTNSNARISEILNAPKGETITVLLEPYVDSSDIKVDSMSSYIKYLVSKYRGNKKEIVFTGSQLPIIEANALSTKAIADKCNAYLKSAQVSYNKLKELEYQISRTSANEEVNKLVMSNTSKAAMIYNAYVTLVEAYYELRLEQSLNYRIILKKFYQF